MRRPRRPLAVALVAAGLLAGCSPAGEDDPRPGNAADRAFLQAILPHHKGLINSARIGARAADHPQARTLGQAIKTHEIAELDAIRATNRAVFDEGLAPSNRAYAKLGLTARAAAMDRLFEPVSEDARPFDRAFLLELIRYHRGAIRLVSAWRARSENPEVGKLAREIADTNRAEIRRMRVLLRRWYG